MISTAVEVKINRLESIVEQIGEAVSQLQRQLKVWQLDWKLSVYKLKNRENSYNNKVIKFLPCVMLYKVLLNLRMIHYRDSPN